ncbi:MAG: tetratricopeptide repeat protein [Methanospirillum sp.]|uniref:tetratricopeptide repeat protein n=1 Tax=Methanospirillum sp. TaxID=45200 RepID=UPI00236AE503|nr:tetratricopeptide repeat protein [Methanospirillum sp.]MDD1728959.1 tetratricopeptide repeat protein [Methanospirillum sp.]
MQSAMNNEGSDPAKQAYINGLKKYRDGDLKAACPYFSQAINGGIGDFDILYYRGMCHLDAGDYQSALIDFEVLVRQYPKNPEYIFRRGFIHYKLGMNAEAIRDLALVPEDFDDCSIRWHYLAVLFYKLEDREAALAAIEKALLKFPTMPKIWFNAGVILAAMDLGDRADLAFVTAAKLDPRLTSVPRQILE